MSLLPNLEALVVDAAERHPLPPGAAAADDAPAAELSRAAARAAAGSRGSRSWLSRHLLLVGVLIAGGAGTATAAVLALRGEPSPPVQGRIQLGARPADGYDYRIRVAPGFDVGQPSWCTTTTVVGDRPEDRVGGAGCRPAPSSRRHTLAESLTGSGDAGQMLLNLVVDDSIAGIRLWNGNVVLTRAEPSLPAGYRAVVARVSGRASRRAYQRDGRAWDLLDASGESVPEPAEDDRSADVAGQPWRAVKGWPPRSAPCAVAARPGTQVQAPSVSRVLQRAPEPVGDIRAGAFLSCLTIDFDGERVGGPRAAVLLDAQHPLSRAPSDLPDQSRPGARGVVEAASPTLGLPAPNEKVVPATLTAKRVGNAWLVVDGGSRGERRRLLDRLEVRLPKG